MVQLGSQPLILRKVLAGGGGSENTLKDSILLTRRII